MLVLSRKLGERIRIGDNVCVSVVRIQGNRVQLGIDAPPEVPVNRQEVQEGRFESSNQEPSWSVPVRLS